VKKFIEDIFINSQNNYTASKSKDDLKSSSQFFTPYDIAKKMISTIDFSTFEKYESISILEPSAGCGILIAVLVEYIIAKCQNIKTIEIRAFENDLNVYEILKQNIGLFKKEIKKKYNIKIKSTIINNNFITFYKNIWKNNNVKKFDIIISNPPYKKINQSSEESMIMSDLLFGQPNIYILFIALSIKLLQRNGFYCVLSPRSYLNGIYAKKLREYIFKEVSLYHIHSFDARNLFKSVYQEVIISTFKKTLNQKTLLISYNNHSSFEAKFDDILLDKNNLNIIVPKVIDDIRNFKQFKNLNYSLHDLGYDLKVGPIVQFRNTKDIRREKYNEEYAPLLIAADIQIDNNIEYYSKEINLKRKTHNRSIYYKNRLLLKNSNYLIIRKITAKNDSEFIVSAVLEKNYFNHTKLGVDNNLLYISKSDCTELTLEECYGLYGYINSNQFKSFYFMINGTHTINVNDFNNIKFPSKNQLIYIGKKLLDKKDFTENYCTELIKNIL